MKYTCIFAFALFGVATSVAATIPFPPNASISLSINGTDETALLGLPAFLSSSNAFTLPSPVTISGLATLNSLVFSTLNDPFINFGSAVDNTSAAPETFSFTFLSPFVGGPYTVLRDSFSDSFTDGNGNGSVTIALAPGATFISQPQVNGVNFDGQGSACAKTGTGGFSGTCNVGGSPANTTIPATAATGTFDDVVSFTLSPGDIYTFNGRVELAGATTPEPGTWILMASGMFIAFAFYRKRGAVRQ